MNYEYTDPDGDKIEIRPAHSIDGVMLSISGTVGTIAAIPVEDAPAVALAILEAAGITPSIGSHPDTTPEEFESAAAFYLREAINKRSKQAEREAEDAKVREYLQAIGIKLAGSDKFELNDYHRRQYRAAREFFAEEDTPAPRVLQYGDPEPDHGTKWEDQDGDIWEWYSGGGGWRTRAAWWPWEKITPGVFPMTEATG